MERRASRFCILTRAFCNYNFCKCLVPKLTFPKIDHWSMQIFVTLSPPVKLTRGSTTNCKHQRRESLDCSGYSGCNHLLQLLLSPQSASTRRLIQRHNPPPPRPRPPTSPASTLHASSPRKTPSVILFSRL